MENVKWYSSSQVSTAKYVSYPQLTATEGRGAVLAGVCIFRVTTPPPKGLVLEVSCSFSLLIAIEILRGTEWKKIVEPPT